MRMQNDPEIAYSEAQLNEIVAVTKVAATLCVVTLCQHSPLLFPSIGFVAKYIRDLIDRRQVECPL